MTDEQNPNQWLSIERLLMEHNITAIESIAVGGSYRSMMNLILEY